MLKNKFITLEADNELRLNESMVTNHKNTLKVPATGICGTDLHILKTGLMFQTDHSGS